MNNEYDNAFQHTTHANKKREIVNENEMEYEYVYNDLLHEYHEQGNNETGDQDSGNLVSYLNSYKVLRFCIVQTVLYNFFYVVDALDPFK